MLAMEETLKRVRHEIGGSDIVLASQSNLSASDCRSLLLKGSIAGYVAANEAEANSDKLGAAGWWIDQARGLWVLKRSASRHLLLVGDKTEIGGRMLITARKAGYSTILIGEERNGSVRSIPIMQWLTERAAATAVYKANYLVTNISILANKQWSYEAAFEDLFDSIGDHLRLPAAEIAQRKAAIVIGSLGAGGAERQATFTATGLAHGGKWVPVVAAMELDPTKGADFFRLAIEKSGVPVSRIEMIVEDYDDPVLANALTRSLKYKLLNFHNLARAAISYAMHFRSEKPQVVQTWMDYCNVLAGAGAALAGVPRIVLGGRSLAPDNFELFQPYMRSGYRALLRRRPDIIFTNNSHAGAADYARWLKLSPDRFKVIHNGFDFPPAEQVATEAAAMKIQLGLPPAAQVVGSVIRFSEEKRPHVLIDMAERVARACPQTRFVFFGGGVMLEEIRNVVAKRGLSDKILLAGQTKNAWAACSIMDVFVLSSRAEGLPNVLIEAQSMGVPVVTTGQGGMVETYKHGETGITAQPATASGLAKAVISLLNDAGKRDAYGRAAFHHARSSFSIAQMIAATSGVFESV